VFVDKLKEFAHRVKDILSTNVPMETLSSEQWDTFCNATQCHVCEKPFASDDTRVCDHCYLTGRYRGSAHSNCNLNYKVDSYYISEVFHNLSGYDAHLIKEIVMAYEDKITSYNKRKIHFVYKKCSKQIMNNKNSEKL